MLFEDKIVWCIYKYLSSCAILSLRQKFLVDQSSTKRANCFSFFSFLLLFLHPDCSSLLLPVLLPLLNDLHLCHLKEVGAFGSSSIRAFQTYNLFLFLRGGLLEGTPSSHNSCSMYLFLLLCDFIPLSMSYTCVGCSRG